MIQCWNSNCHAELWSLPNHAVKIVAGTTALQIFQCLTCFGPQGDAKLLHQDRGVQLGPTARVLPEHFFGGSALVTVNL